MLTRLAALAAAFVVFAPGQTAPDLILRNAKVITLDDKAPEA